MPSRWCSSRTHCKLCGHKCACVCVIEGGLICRLSVLSDLLLAWSASRCFSSPGVSRLCVSVHVCVHGGMCFLQDCSDSQINPSRCIVLIVLLGPISVNDTTTTAPSSPRVWFDSDSTWLHIMPSYPAGEGFKAALGKILIWKYIYQLILIHKLGLEGKKTQDSSQLTPRNSDATFLWNWSKFSSILKL